MLALKVLADLHPVAEPSPNLIARAHLRLDDALDTLPPKSWFERLGERILSNFASLQAAPVAASLLLVAGSGAGLLGGYEYAQNRVAHAASTAQVSVPPAPAEAKVQPAASLPELDNVAGVSGIVRQPNSEIVDVSYSQLVPRQIEGSLDDPASASCSCWPVKMRSRPAFATIPCRCLRPSAAPATVASPPASATRS